MKDKVSVIGQGYVGLPLAVSAAENGFIVMGIDIDSRKVDLINSGHSPIEDLDGSRILDLIKSGHYFSSTDYSNVADSKIVIICVPTPLNSNRQPDNSYINSAVISIGKYLKPGTLVILESTVEPGTTRKLVFPNLCKESGLAPNKFDLSFSPERIDPVNKKWNISNTPKIVSGMTIDAKKRAVDFYSKFIKKVITVDSLEVAETAKLLENSFRFINISFINEMSVFCQKIGIEVIEVIAAASTKPYGFMPFYPSIGVGGHCIPVDPIYLANAAKAVDAPSRFIELADQINQEMPGYFVGRAEEKLGGLKSKKVLVIGVSYKPNVADVRETPVEALISGLKNKGAQVLWHDDLVKEWNGEKSAALSSNFDLAIIATPHDYLDLTKLGDVPILNTRGSI